MSKLSIILIINITRQVFPPLQGDLGSPLVARSEGGTWVQVGVAVGGDGCADDTNLHQHFAPRAPAVYISVISESQ